MRAGRFVCVALPAFLTIGGIIALLIGTLSGVAHNRLYIFSADLSDLNLDEKDLKDILSDYVPGVDKIPDLSSLKPSVLGARDIEPRQITATNLGLSSRYEVSLWGYCMVATDGKRTCKKPEFNWAAKHLNEDILDKIGVGGMKIKLPREIDSAVHAFATVTRYTEIAFIVALLALGLELFVGIFAYCTRVISCLTWLLAIIAIILTFLACALATAMGTVVTGAIKATAKTYGARASVNTKFLACIWIGAAFAVAASLFWLFTLCCCKPDHNRSKKRRSDGEKLLPKSHAGGYAPISGNNEVSDVNPPQYYHNHKSQPAYDSGHSTYSGRDTAYEPYSHR